jgi:hypothetical protein
MAAPPVVSPDGSARSAKIYQFPDKKKPHQDAAAS